MQAKLMQRLKTDAFGGAGGQCPGCGAMITGQIVSRLLVDREDVVLHGGTCGFNVNNFVAAQNEGQIPGMLGAQITGLLEAMRVQKIPDKKLVIFAGEGYTTSMGLGTTLHAFSRNLPFTIIVMNNEVFAMSGYHMTSRSPWHAADKAHLKGKDDPPIFAPMMMMFAGAKYVATASLAYPEDLVAKVDTALEHQPSYIECMTPCEPGWVYSVGKTVELTRLATRTEMWPLWECLNNEARPIIRRTVQTAERLPITEYTKLQRRFRHISEADIANLSYWIDKQSELLKGLENGFSWFEERS